MKFRKSIFRKLIGSFILYAVVILITFILCFALEAALIGEGSIAGASPGGIIDEYGNVVNSETVQKIGGWVEELDDNCNVIKVYGEKKTADVSYSADDLLSLTAPYVDTEYIGFFIQPEKSQKRFLCIYIRDVMQVNPTIILNNVTKYGTTDILWIFFPLLIAEVVIISLYLRRKIKKPLDKIIVGMENLKAGDSSSRINIKTEAEYKKIVDTFNMMAEQLENEKAEKENLTRKKNRMLLELSHDIKTPVATIKSYANALEAGLVSDEKKPDVYRIIDAKADRVQKLSDDMFMMLKMDNPDYNLILDKVNLCEYMRRLCAEYYDEITGEGFDFVIDIPEEGIWCRVDLNLFSRVIGNLLSNAAKYNKAGKHISVSLSLEGERVCIAVADDGDEIDSNFAKQMFDAFSRGDEARKSHGGTGLGLAISRVIVEKHGGSIEYFRKNNKNIFEVGIKKYDTICKA